MRIQHNIMAMNAYRNYTNNVSAMKANLEKLSSGYKINRAGDDAAGLAISEKMRAQITGLETAQKNAKDGISLVQTAEGALTEVHDMLNRMVELATQSANGTYDNTTDRAQLQKEMDQLKTEINRIADSANFNGIKLLDGSMDSGTDNVALKDASDVATGTGTAAGMGFTIVSDGQLVDKAPTAGKYSVDFSQAKLLSSSTGAIAVTFQVTTDLTVAITVAGGANMDGKDIAEALAKAIQDKKTGYDSDVGMTIMKTASSAMFKVSAEGDKLVFEMVDAPSKDSDINGLVFDTKFTDGVKKNDGDSVGATLVGGNSGNQFHVSQDVEAVSKASRVYGQATFNLTDAFVKDGAAIKIGDTTYTFAVGNNSKYKDYANLVDLTDISLAANGKLTSDQLKTAAQRLQMAAKDNKNFIVGTQVGSNAISLTEREGGVDYTVNNLAGTDGKASINGAVDTDDAAKTDWKGLIKIGTASIDNAATGRSLTLQIGDTAESFNQLKVNIKDIHTGSIGIDGISIADQDSAAKAIDAIKSAINYVSDVRGTLGATQNRLDHTINNLSVMTENIQDAESTIRDVDVAEEMMAYTKNNILIQSAQAMLAQANQVPQGVLQLLQ